MAFWWILLLTLALPVLTFFLLGKTLALPVFASLNFSSYRVFPQPSSLPPETRIELNCFHFPFLEQAYLGLAPWTGPSDWSQVKFQ